jgi:Tol biopolymer transport system component
MTYFQRPRWSPDGSIIMQGIDLKGTQGIFRVNVQTGEVSPFVLGDNGERVVEPAWVPGGTSLVFRRVDATMTSLVVRDTQSGIERVLIDKTSALILGLKVSPDGQAISFVHSDPASRIWSLQTTPVGGGPIRELFRVAAPERLSALTEWTPDGGSILIGRSSNGTDKGAIWAVPSAGGAPRKIEGLVAGSDLRLSPDGRQAAYSDGEMSEELWSLENLASPAATAEKRRAE